MPRPWSYCHGGCGAACCNDRELPTSSGLCCSAGYYLGGKPQRPSKYSVHCFGGGGQTVEAAGSCAGGGGGKGLEAALGAGSALAVCVLRPPTWWTGLQHRMEHDVDWIGCESRWRILPERVVRLRPPG